MNVTMDRINSFKKRTTSSFDIIFLYSVLIVFYIAVLGNRANVILSVIALIALLPLIKNPKYLIGPMFFVTIFDEYLIAFIGHSFSRYICFYFIVSVLLSSIKRNVFTKINIHSLAVLFMMLMGVILSIQGLYGYTALPVAYIFALLQFFFLMKCRSITSVELVNILFIFSVGAIVFAVLLMFGNGLSALSETKRVTIGETNANTTAFGLAVVYSVLFTHFLLHGFKKKIFHSMLLLAGIFCVFLTGSRTALISCFASSIVVLYCSLKKNIGKFKKAFAVILFFSVVFIMTYEYLLVRFPVLMERFTVDNVLMSGGTGRVYIWEAYFKFYFPSYWLFGIGFDPLNMYHAIERATYIGHGAHNIFVDILASSGVFGLLVYGTCFFRWLRAMYKGLEKDRLLIVPFGMVICILFLGIGENVFRAKILWLSFGFGFIMLNGLKAGINDDK